VTLLGQYHAASQTERPYDELSFDFYYHDNSADWRAPAFLQMQSGFATDTVTVTVQAKDASGIHAIVVSYTDDSGL
jgi:hypothetical protein